MRTLTATEASRSLAAHLDQVEEGETVIITRGGRRVTSMGSAATGNGAEVMKLLAGRAIDSTFRTDVDSVRDAIELEGAWSSALRLAGATSR